MRTTSRLELALVAAGDPPRRGIAALLHAWRAAGRIVDGGGPGAGAAWFGTTFARVRIDEPGRLTLYANRQGGFRVACPVTGAPAVAAFSSAWERARARPGEDELPRVACPCGSSHRLDALHFAPPAAFGRVAVVFADVAEPRVSPEADAALREVLGPATWVARRG